MTETNTVKASMVNCCCVVRSDASVDVIVSKGGMKFEGTLFRFGEPLGSDPTTIISKECEITFPKEWRIKA